MDHLARAQRMLELQEAENARVSYCLYSCWGQKQQISCSAFILHVDCGSRAVAKISLKNIFNV